MSCGAPLKKPSIFLSLDSFFLNATDCSRQIEGERSLLKVWYFQQLQFSHQVILAQLIEVNFTFLIPFFLDKMQIVRVFVFQTLLIINQLFFRVREFLLNF